MLWPGCRENDLVARREDDSDGTCRQFGMVIRMPADVKACMVPWPIIAAFVLPSANVTESGDGHALYSIKWCLLLSMVCDAPESINNLVGVIGDAVVLLSTAIIAL